MNNSRMCGEGREAGGVYFEVASSQDGAPIDFFLMCPPVPIDAEEQKRLGISPIGMSLLPQKDADGNTIYHIADWIGESHYPDIWDFLTEGSALNFSRRVPSTFDFSKLSNQSRIYFIHPRGWIENWPQYFEHEPSYPLTECCPHDVAIYRMGGRFPTINDHSHSYKHHEFCSRLWLQDLTESKKTKVRYISQTDRNKEISERLVQKMLPCEAHYQGFMRPLEVTPQYRAAIIGSFPLGRIAVVKSPDGEHSKKAEKARKQTAFAVVEVDE